MAFFLLNILMQLSSNLSMIPENIKFEDGKWLFATYASKGAELETCTLFDATT